MDRGYNPTRPQILTAKTEPDEDSKIAVTLPRGEYALMFTLSTDGPDPVHLTWGGVLEPPFPALMVSEGSATFGPFSSTQEHWYVAKSSGNDQEVQVDVYYQRARP